MGFAGLFSTSSQAYQVVTNKQIGQSGAGSVALSGDVAGNLNITNADPEIALAAIQASSQNQIRALETLSSLGDRYAGVAENAVSSAGNTALNALPLTPEQIAASRGDASSLNSQQTLVKIGVLVTVLIVGVMLYKKFKP